MKTPSAQGKTEQRLLEHGSIHIKALPGDILQQKWTASASIATSIAKYTKSNLWLQKDGTVHTYEEDK